MKKITTILCMALVCVVSAFALVGCSGVSFDAEGNILVGVRPESSGTRSAFMELIGEKNAEAPSGAVTWESTASVMSGVSTNGQAIGYESLGYVDSTVKILKVGGYEATAENIIAGDYKIARPLNILHKPSYEDDQKLVAFYDFMTSTNAQTIVTDAGYVAVATNTTAYDSTKYSGISGTITCWGSTSVNPLMGKFADEFEKLHSGITITIGGSGSGDGYTSIANSTADFGMISAEFDSSKADASVDYTTLCQDGIAVVVNKANTVENVTLDQLAGIFSASAETKITSWSTLV